MNLRFLDRVFDGLASIARSTGREGSSYFPTVVPVKRLQAHTPAGAEYICSQYRLRHRKPPCPTTQKRSQSNSHKSSTSKLSQASRVNRVNRNISRNPLKPIPTNTAKPNYGATKTVAIVTPWSALRCAVDGSTPVGRVDGVDWREARLALRPAARSTVGQSLLALAGSLPWHMSMASCFYTLNVV